MLLIIKIEGDLDMKDQLTSSFMFNDSNSTTTRQWLMDSPDLLVFRNGLIRSKSLYGTCCLTIRLKTSFADYHDQDEIQFQTHFCSQGHELLYGRMSVYGGFDCKRCESHIHHSWEHYRCNICKEHYCGHCFDRDVVQEKKDREERERKWKKG